jgi:hypothetical protein
MMGVTSDSYGKGSCNKGGWALALGAGAAISMCDKLAGPCVHQSRSDRSASDAKTLSWSATPHLQCFRISHMVDLFDLTKTPSITSPLHTADAGSQRDDLLRRGIICLIWLVGEVLGTLQVPSAITSFVAIRSGTTAPHLPIRPTMSITTRSLVATCTCIPHVSGSSS